jgi:hypothetical protein
MSLPWLKTGDEDPYTLEAAVFDVCKENPWAATWFRLGRIIVGVPGRSWEAESPQDLCPSNVETLGCTGANSNGNLSWIGWDLDVGHGITHYQNQETALADARKIRDAFKGEAEIRLSKSGVGVHVRHLLRESTPAIPAIHGKEIAKGIARKLGIKADPSALGRQAFWLWVRNPMPDAFKLIEDHVHV